MNEENESIHKRQQHQDEDQQHQRDNPLKLFDKIRILGRGSYGLASVHRRRHDRTLVVLKEIDLLRFKGDEGRLSTINEVEIMSSLDHPNIIKYFNAYATENKLIIEMEYANFGTLATYLSLQSPLEDSEILIIFKQITSGLNYLHNKNIIHLDLKMENIFLTNDGLIKIGDFGIAKHLNNPANGSTNENCSGPFNTDRNNEASTFQCTLAFSSPERCLGQATDFKSDIWSLGCILYELITSKPLFSASSIAQLIMNITHISYMPIKRPIPDLLRETFERMISAQPEDRPSADELCRLTNQLLSSQTTAQHLRLASCHQLETNTNSLLHPKSQRNRVNSFHQQTRNHDQLQGDISSELVWRGPSPLNQDDFNQLFYPHSLVYQVSLGGPNIRLDRVSLPQSKRIRQIVRGESHYLALTYDNIVFGWGSREYGQLGGRGLCRSAATSQEEAACEQTNNNKTSPGTPTTPRQQNGRDLTQLRPTSKPIVINELNHRKILQVAAGKNFSLFRNKVGIVMSCGDGSSGCLGHGDLESRSNPYMVESLFNNDVVYIAAGPRHVIAICGDGSTYAWGKTSHGRLGIELEQPNSSIILDRPRRVHFPDNVLIKKAFCGHRSTVFIDSRMKCWACGDNRHNKLGLDVTRRFKRTKLVEFSPCPQEIEPLIKLDIVSCSVGRNHCTYLSSDARLYVLGQDIDGYTTTRGNNLDTNSKNIGNRSGTTSYITRPTIKRVNNFLINEIQAPISRVIKSYRSSGLINDDFGGGQPDEEAQQDQRSGGIARRTTSIWARQESTEQLHSQTKKYRSLRKMPFDMVLSSAIGGHFSVASTKDNRVYFWGTRTYTNEAETRSSRAPPTGGSVSKGFNSTAHKSHRRYALEPQLVPHAADDCFIRIATTNQSVMQTIQEIGSDHPIIHAQDPRLVINHMSEMWILDYQSERLPESSCSSSSSCDGDSNLSNSKRTNSDFKLSEQSADSLSCCSSCCSSGCCSATNSIQFNNQQTIESSSHVVKIRHDAILEPQPILSLYVPSMFNVLSNSLRISKVYCFDEDRFYLVLETTIRNNQIRTTSSSQLNTPLTPRTRKKQEAMTKNHPPTNMISGNSIANYKLQRSRRASLPIELDRSPREVSRLIEERIKMSSVVGSADQAESLANNHHHDNKQLKQEGKQLNQEHEVMESILFDKNPDHKSKLLKSHHAIETSGSDPINEPAGKLRVPSDDEQTEVGDCLVGQASSLGMSLDEPRSLSTFATMGSNETQIVIGPGNKHQTELLEQPIEPITERNFLSFSKRLRRVAKGGRSRRRKRAEIKSESTTGNEEAEETSPMPSWVRNEFMQHQHQRSQNDNSNSGSGCGSATNATRRQRILLAESTNEQEIFQIESSTEYNSRSEVSITQQGTAIDLTTQIGVPQLLLDGIQGSNDNNNNPTVPAMVMTADIPEVPRPRAKSFGETMINKTIPKSMHGMMGGARGSIVGRNSNKHNQPARASPAHIPTSLNVSQQQQWNSSNEYLANYGYEANISWIPSVMDEPEMKPALERLMQDSQSSSRTEGPTNERNGAGGSGLTMASLRKSIIKLFR